MQLLIIRHALAGERQAFARTGRPDDLRPITPAGRRTTRESLPALRSLVPWIDVLAASPLTRAGQTADIVATAYPAAERETHNFLAPGGKRRALLRWLRSREGSDVVSVVGHEPDLGELASWLLGGRRRAFVALEKGAAALLEFGRRLEPGRGELLWSLPPRALVGLGRALAR